MRSGRKRVASGRIESCEKGASGRPPLNRARSTSAPGQDRLAGLTAIDVEDMAGDE
jgi:hypothetical protein